MHSAAHFFCVAECFFCFLRNSIGSDAGKPHEMKTELLIKNNVFPIPVGDFFHKETDACYLVYAPLSNVFYLSTGDEVRKLEQTLKKGEDTPLVRKLLKQDAFKAINQEVSVDTFCTLHLLLNEKCNFSCKYCYSANGRSKAELTEDQIYTTLDYFLSSERAAVKDRTVMFMGGGEPTFAALVKVDTEG